MYYGAYKNIRESAWQCLLDFKVDSLPVDVRNIAAQAGIKVVSNSTLDVLKPEERGRSYFDGELWVIIYNDKMSVERSRYTLAHEIGHIFLGHDLKHSEMANVKKFSSKPRLEIEADTFALRLLCPACVIHSLELQSAQEIAEYCKIELPYAEQRFSRMKVLNKRNKFLTSETEQQIYQNFLEYIKNTLQTK